MSDAIDQYRQLRDRVDLRGGRLIDMHCKHIACRAGCSDCCTDISVSPVEYAAILGDLRAAGVTTETLPHDPAAACAFLKGNLCGLYRFRPLICRTHGLPVAFMNDDEGEGDRPRELPAIPEVQGQRRGMAGGGAGALGGWTSRIPM